MAVEDPTKKQTEQVDPEVAEILGLEDSFDLDQEEYITLLKEKMVEARMNESKFSSEQAMKITDEYKRVKNLKESTFTVPKKTVNADSFFGKKKKEQNGDQEQKPVTDISKLLPGSGGGIAKYQKPEKLKIAEKKEEDTTEDKSADKVSDKVSNLENFLNGSLLDIVKDIRKLTEDILSILTKQSSVDKKGAELFRRESEKKGKKSKEDKLEAKEEKKGLGLVEKIAKPFTSIFDAIRNFVMNILLGSLVHWILSVIQNPMMLLKPIQGLIDGISGFFNNIIQFIDNMVVQPVRNFIDLINSALNGFIDIVNSALKILPGSPQIGNANIPNIPEPPELKGPDITGERTPKEQESKPQGPPVNLRFSGGEIKQTIQQKATGGIIESLKNTPIIQKTTAGSISSPASSTEQQKKWSFDDQVSREGGNVSSKTTSLDITGLGPDKHLTALSTGEYVLKKGAADWLGGPAYLDGLNKMFGGSSERKVASLGDIKIKAMSSGGQVSSSSSGSKSPNTSSTTNTNSKGASFSPTKYIQGTKNTNHIVVGNNPPKSYALRYKQEGTKFTVKQINKVVKQGWNFLSGNDDGLIGVNPTSLEGKSILSSLNVRNYFENLYKNTNNIKNATGNIEVQNRVKQQLKNIKINLDKDAEIAYWYNQSYKTHYDGWRKKPGISDEQARQFAASAATEFAISKSSKGSKGSWLPGSSQSGAPESLKDVGVESNIPDSTSATSQPSGQPESFPAEYYADTFKGDAASQSYIDSLSPSPSPSPSAPPSSAPTAITKPGPKGGPAGKPKPKPKTPSSSDLGYRVGRGIWGALSDLGPGLLGQIQGKDNAALKRQRIRGQKFLKLITTGKLDSPTKSKSKKPSVKSSSPTFASSSRSSNVFTKTETPSDSPEVTKYMEAAAAARKSKDPAEMAKVRDMGMGIWAKSNPKLAASATERERTKGTSATTNPLMSGFKDRLPSPKTPSPTTTSTAFSKSTPSLGSSTPAIQSAGSNVASTSTTNQTSAAFSSPTPIVSSPISSSPEPKTGMGGPSSKSGSPRPGQNNKVSENPIAQYVRSLFNNPFNKTARNSGHYGKYAAPSQQIKTPSAAVRPSTSRSSSRPKSKPFIAPAAPTDSPEVTKYMEAAAAARKSKDPAEMAKVRDMGMGIWAKSNPKLAAAATERERTKGTSATTNPLMSGFKDRLPSPKTPSADIASKGFGLSSKGIELSKPSTLSSSVSFPKTTSSSFSSGFGLSSKGVELSKPSTIFPKTPSTDIASKGFDLSSKGFGLPSKATELSKPSTLPIAPSNITSPTKPNIPGPPESKSNVSVLPLPSQAQTPKPSGGGVTKGGSTPTVTFSSFNVSEPSTVATAALYNIWGM